MFYIVLDLNMIISSEVMSLLIINFRILIQLGDGEKEKV